MSENQQQTQQPVLLGLNFDQLLTIAQGAMTLADNIVALVQTRNAEITPEQRERANQITASIRDRALEAARKAAEALEEPDVPSQDPRV